MTRLYRIDHPTYGTMTLVWAGDPEDALRMSSLDGEVGKRDLRATDITDLHVAAENPYRDLSLAVIASGAHGEAHLRLTSDPETTGWLFADGRLVVEDDPGIPAFFAARGCNPLALCA